MNKEKTNSKTKLLLTLLLVVLLLAAIFIFGGDEEISVAAPDDIVVGRELLELFDQLKLVTLDNSIFTDPVFQSLTDFGQEVAPQPVGRPNPFAPIGQTGSSRSIQTVSSDSF